MMFSVDQNDNGAVRLSGRLDAASAREAERVLDEAAGECVIDMTELEYISSAGLGVLLRTHKRLLSDGGIRLVGVSPHIRDIFKYSGFDKLFPIEAA